SSLPGIVPSNTYECGDGKYIVIGGNGDSIFKRLMKAIGREDIALDEAYATNERRAQHTEFLDGTILDWTKSHSREDAHQILHAYSVPHGPIRRVEHMIQDRQSAERKMIQSAEVAGLGASKMPGILPQVPEHPGETKRPGPQRGPHHEEVYNGLLRMHHENLA